jgi:hypothetical protein
MHSTFNLRRFTSGGKSPRSIEGRVPCLLRLERKKTRQGGSKTPKNALQQAGFKILELPK